MNTKPGASALWPVRTTCISGRTVCISAYGSKKTVWPEWVGAPTARRKSSRWKTDIADRRSRGRDLRRRGMPATRACRRGRCPGMLGRVAGCVSRDARATLLGAHTCPGGQCQGDCERARQVAQAAAAAREGRVARDHPGTAPGQVCAHRTGRVRKRKVSTSWKSTKRAIPKQRSAS